MANDINTPKGAGSGCDSLVTGSIKYGNPVVQAPRKSSTSNNFVDEHTYTAYTKASGDSTGIGNIKGRYDARFDDPTYYSA